MINLLKLRFRDSFVLGQYLICQLSVQRLQILAELLNLDLRCFVLLDGIAAEETRHQRLNFFLECISPQLLDLVKLKVQRPLERQLFRQLSTAILDNAPALLERPLQLLLHQ